MKFDKEKLAKLSPEERIKRLREIEQESKRDLEEAEKHLKESKKMLDESQLEITRKEIEKERNIPPDRRIDLSELVRSKEDNIESTVEFAQRQNEHDQQNITDLYTRITEIADIGVDYQRKNELTQLYEEVNKRAENVTAKYGTPTKEFEDIASNSKRLIKELLGEFYDEGQRYHPA